MASLHMFSRVFYLQQNISRRTTSISSKLNTKSVDTIRNQYSRKLYAFWYSMNNLLNRYFLANQYPRQSPNQTRVACQLSIHHKKIQCNRVSEIERQSFKFLLSKAHFWRLTLYNTLKRSSLSHIAFIRTGLMNFSIITLDCLRSLSSILIYLSWMYLRTAFGFFCPLLDILDFLESFVVGASPLGKSFKLLYITLS